MTEKEEKMIPVSVIDALITKVEDSIHTQYSPTDVIDLLEEIKKEAR